MNHRANLARLTLAVLATGITAPAKAQAPVYAALDPRGSVDPVQVYKPGTIDVVVAGGDASPMMLAWHMYRPQTVSIDKWQ